MPTITHAIIGGAIGLILFTATQNQTKLFKAEHVILLALNSFIGPDLAKFFSPFYGPGYWSSNTFRHLNGTIHTITGWLGFAVILSLMYYGIFRFTGEGKRSGQSAVTWPHTYFVIVAGGMNHLGIDMLDSPIRIFPVFTGNDTTVWLENFKTGEHFAEGVLWDSMSWVDDKILLLLGIFFMFLLIWLLKNKDVKWVYLVAGLFGILIYSIIWFVGSNVVKNENDFGFLFYALFTWLGPLALCVISFDYKEKVKTQGETIKQSLHN